MGCLCGWLGSETYYDLDGVIKLYFFDYYGRGIIKLEFI